MPSKIPRKMMYSDDETDSGDEKVEISPTIQSYSDQLWNLFALLRSEILAIDW